KYREEATYPTVQTVDVGDVAETVGETNVLLVAAHAVLSVWVARGNVADLLAGAEVARCLRSLRQTYKEEEEGERKREAGGYSHGRWRTAVNSENSDTTCTGAIMRSSPKAMGSMRGLGALWRESGKRT
ncbi:MAG: hypothetical protein Q9214_002917, partial [Letrouitia sp. 1 TL-2023]